MKLAEELKTDRGLVIGFGRIKIPKIPKFDFNLEVPLLSFIVVECEYRREYVATCIHLQMDGYGVSVADAINDLVGDVMRFFLDNFGKEEQRGDAWYRLYELSKSNPRTGALWDKYHALQYIFAEMGEPDHYAEVKVSYPWGTSVGGVCSVLWGPYRMRK